MSYDYSYDCILLLRPYLPVCMALARTPQVCFALLLSACVDRVVCSTSYRRVSVLDAAQFGNCGFSSSPHRVNHRQGFLPLPFPGFAPKSIKNCDVYLKQLTLSFH